MYQRRLLPTLGLLMLIVLNVIPSSAQQSADEYYQYLLSLCDPYLVRCAEEAGLYNRDELPIWREENPFFIRGDFNGDGAIDVAFWVKEKASTLKGIAILHNTLDTLYVFGAGRSRPPGGGDSLQLLTDTWHLIHPGHVVERPFGNIPEIGLEDGQPFKFERETLEFVVLAKSASVIYWANGQYWEFWTAD